MEEYGGKLGHCCGFLNLGNVAALVLITNPTRFAHEMEAFIPQYCTIIDGLIGLGPKMADSATKFSSKLLKQPVSYLVSPYEHNYTFNH